MVFSGIPFLYFFLPILLPIYFISPKKSKNVILLIFSFIFYAAGEPIYIFLMLISIIQAYFLALSLSPQCKEENSQIIVSRKKKYRKLLFILSLILSTLPLIFYKYSDFIIENFNLIFGFRIPSPKVTLPVGISFYTFQLIGYTADVYLGKCKPQRNPSKLALYISMFPQLIAGPIVRYHDVADALENRTTTLSGFAEGAVRFTVGLGKKVIFANTLGELCNLVGNSALGTWVYAISATLQIYFDFSGYSDMAIGLGKIFGFEFPENFDYPYISLSITEFWRRWHMSLGTWFRDYVYIPLGGNRVSRTRWIFNILAVWMLTGLWHGAEWTFVIWGLYFAVLLIVEKSAKKYIERIPNIIRHAGVLFLVGISFVLFNSSSLSNAVSTVARMFDFTNPVDKISIYYLRSYAVTIAAAIIGSTPIMKTAVEKIKHKLSGEQIINALTPVFVLFTLIISTAYIVDGSFNPFLYFRF